ncbi:hypothetical protein GCK32_002454 [Trichostrongylus colubriformis]|uniref:Uncharacterized protein n=1 Tax=Trichostrongylus colubriformis TaxID=6319 RepID=A0AAN8FQ28_TRICO
MRAVVFAVTFLSYGLYHSARKTLSGVKTSVTNDWLDNVTHAPLFDSNVGAKTFLGTLDAVFMIAYASGLFFWGWLGDRLNPKHVIVTGMIGSAISLTLFGAVPKWSGYYNVAYYVFFYILFGLMQACGWPSEIAIMTSLGWESVFYLFMMLNTLAIACIMKRCLMDLKPLANETWSFDLKNDESDAFILLVCLSFLVCR